ncbi:MAG: AlpA family phage regulatory protein [Luteitalea sp.]|nr:AlpA family phage regulatory protein [Luteitalea sp.]
MSEGLGGIRARDESGPWNSMNARERTRVSAHELVQGRVSDDTPPSAAASSPHSLKLLRFPAVRERAGLSRSTICRMERRGSFPGITRLPPTQSDGPTRSLVGSKTRRRPGWSG